MLTLNERKRKTKRKRKRAISETRYLVSYNSLNPP
jgi:hypothetical protein